MFRLFSEKKTIDDFDILTIRVSGMRLTEEYEISRKVDNAVISLYEISYTGDGEERRLKANAELPAGDVISVMNDCRVLSWDGFRGRHPAHVSDGEMFSMEAVVDGGRRISASGSENFPKGYIEFMRWLGETVRNG